MRSGSHLGAIFGRGRYQVAEILRKSLHFGDQNPPKIVNFRHLFLDVFLDGIFDGFERLLELILEGFGRPNGA